MLVPSPPMARFPLGRVLVATVLTGALLGTLSEAPAWRRALTGWGPEPLWAVGLGVLAGGLYFGSLFAKHGRRKALPPLLWTLVLGAIVLLVLPRIGLEIERIHLFQYGGLVVLYAWALRPVLPGFSGRIPAAGMAFAVGLLDESLQYALPTRVGDLQDVWLNGLSVMLGFLFLDRVLGREPWPRGEAFPRRLVGTLGGLLILMTAGVVTYLTHPGYFHQTREGIGFYSRFTQAELLRRDAEQAAHYAREVKRLYGDPMHSYLKRQRELDPYLAELLVRLFRRNVHAQSGRPVSAWAENEILREFFPEVVRLSGQAWPKERSSDPAPGEAAGLVSPVGAGEIRVALGTGTLWLLAGLAATACLIWGWRRPRPVGCGGLPTAPRSPARMGESL